MSNVLLVTRSDARFLARNAEALYRIHLLQRLRINDSIRVLDHTKLHSIGGDHVTLVARDSMVFEQPASAILLAHGLAPNTELADALSTVAIPVIPIGDAA